MSENELKELPVERVTLVPAGSTLVFQVTRNTPDSEMKLLVESIRNLFPDHRCVVLRDAKLFAAIERNA